MGWRSSAASVAASMTWRMARGGAATNAPELAFTVGMSIVRVKVGSYISNKIGRKRRKLTRRCKISVRKTFKWIVGRDRVETSSSETKETRAIDCDRDRYRKLAQRRLDCARVRFEAARLDVMEAEEDLREAEARCREKRVAGDDIVYVEYAQPGAQIKSMM